MRLGGAGLAGLMLLAATAHGWAQPPAAAPAPAAPAAAAAAQSVAPMRVIVLPPVQWDWTMTDGHPLLHQGPSDLAALTGGIVFGMQPNAVNNLVPDPTTSLDWADLALVSELTQDVRYFWIKVAGSRDLGGGVTACYGANSYIVFLFQDHALFRLSYRFLPGPGCADPHEAALSVFARYTAISTAIAVTVHYRVGTTEVVDVTDPGSGDLLYRRWIPRGQ